MPLLTQWTAPIPSLVVVVSKCAKLINARCLGLSYERLSIQDDDETVNPIKSEVKASTRFGSAKEKKAGPNGHLWVIL